MDKQWILILFLPAAMLALFAALGLSGIDPAARHAIGGLLGLAFAGLLYAAGLY